MEKLPILYSFRRCPYAMRARLALFISNTKCELREVLLKAKPEQLIKISKKGTVPVLQLAPKKIIDESLDIMVWALKNHDPGNWLPKDTITMEDTLSLINNCDSEFKHNLDRYKYGPRFNVEDTSIHRGICETFIKDLNNRLHDHTYLMGDTASLADYAIVPFIRQFANTDGEWFYNTPYPLAHKWLDKLLASDLFLSIMTKYDPWHEGQTPIYFHAEC